MQNNEYEKYYTKIIERLEKEKYINFATSNKDGIIACSTMSMININTKIYFQTDKYSEKVKNILENENVGLSLNQMYFKGKAKLVGHPTNCKEYLELIHDKHPYTEKSYIYLKDEVLIVIELYECKIWGYEKVNGKLEEVLRVINFNDKSVKLNILPNLSNGYENMRIE